MRWKMPLSYMYMILAGAGTLKHLESEVVQNKKENELAEKLEDFSYRNGAYCTSYTILSGFRIGNYQ